MFQRCLVTARVLNSCASESRKSLFIIAMIWSKNYVDIVKIYTKQESQPTVYLGQSWMNNMNHIIYFVN